VFFRLATIEVGDTVRVTQAGGEVLAYRVVARESIRKQRLPADELFARDGSPRLTLITCSGPYVAQQGGYQDNLVVTATPVRPAPMADQS
jgi:LPXTG-site transpeptidase (sortase) family protein